MSEIYEYIICGGGTVGCVLASRLSHAGRSVLVVEAGPEDCNDKIMSPIAAPHLHGTEWEYNLMTTKTARTRQPLDSKLLGQAIVGFQWH